MGEQTNILKPNVTCHAPGDRCHACAHYRGEAAVCEFAPPAAATLPPLPKPYDLPHDGDGRPQVLFTSDQMHATVRAAVEPLQAEIGQLRERNEFLSAMCREAQMLAASLQSAALAGAQTPMGGESELSTCNCRWRGAEVVQQCELHAAWKEAIHEWAERAKVAEAARTDAPSAASNPEPVVGQEVLLRSARDALAEHTPKTFAGLIKRIDSAIATQAAPASTKALAFLEAYEAENLLNEKESIGVACSDAEYFEAACKTSKAAHDFRFALAAPPEAPAQPVAPSLQQRVEPWLIACFGEEIAGDKVERNHRFLEEALELVQAAGCTQSEAHQLVDYVFGRPIGDIHQEAGGVMVTLAALCRAHGIDMHDAGESELTRIWTKVEQIRAKQAAKPKHSPLPGPTIDAPAAPKTDAAERVVVRDVPIPLGAYVLATKYADGDPGDHWALGFYTGSDRLGASVRYYVRDSDGNNIRGSGFRAVRRIREDVGRWLLGTAAKQLEASPPGTVNLWTMLTDLAFVLPEDGEPGGVS